MHLRHKLSAILELAERLGFEVRHEPLGGSGGGACVLKGQRVLFVDSGADLATQCERCLADLARIAEIDTMYVVPELRDEIDRLRGRGG